MSRRPRGECPECGREIAMTHEGIISPHGDNRLGQGPRPDTYCAGTGKVAVGYARRISQYDRDYIAEEIRSMVPPPYMGSTPKMIEWHEVADFVQGVGSWKDFEK